MRVYVSGGTGFERCVRICPVLSSNLGWDLGLEGKAIPSISRQLEAILKGGREKYNREELWGEGRGARVLLWHIKDYLVQSHNE